MSDRIRITVISARTLTESEATAMKRIIGDKLNFLMLITETKNNILGKAISFDPSYISRIRTGARGVPKHRDFIYPAAAFFAQAVQTKEQKEKLAEVICPGSGWPKDVNSAISLIANWLKQDLSIGSSFRNHSGNVPLYGREYLRFLGSIIFTSVAFIVVIKLLKIQFYYFIVI